MSDEERRGPQPLLTFTAVLENVDMLRAVRGRGWVENILLISLAQFGSAIGLSSKSKRKCVATDSGNGKRSPLLWPLQALLLTT